jgi:SAM-dependent methyltransferase
LNDPHDKIELSRSQRRFVESLLKYIGDCEVMLDAGCGSGWFGEALKEYLSATVIGVDLKTPKSPTRKFNCEHFAVMDVRSLGISESIDLVIAKDVLEHLSCPMSAMKEFARVLKNNGRILITVPSPQAPFLWDDYTHVRPFTKASLYKLLVDAGFEVLFIRYLAAPTPGAALLRIEGFLNSLADRGFRKGNVLAMGIKRAESVKGELPK